MNPPATIKASVTSQAKDDLERLRLLMGFPGYEGPSETDIISDAITAAYAATMGKINGRK